MKPAKTIAAFGMVALFFCACKRELSCEGCADKNKPPLALAGKDTTITLPADSVLLDGSASTDPDGKISAWQWTRLSGPASFMVVSSSAAKTLVKSLTQGVYHFELQVTDDGGLSAKDTVMVTVETGLAANHPPLACAGEDQTITLPTDTVDLDGRCSTDPDNNITAHQWTKIAGPTSFSIVNGNTAQTQASNLTEGVYWFELKVTDAGGLFSKDTVQVTVNAAVVSNCGSNRPQIIWKATLLGIHPNPRKGMAVVAVENKIIFAGGQVGTSSDRVGSARVDIYDIATNTWSGGTLSVPRMDITAITAGTKVFFAGGRTGQIYDVTEQYFSTVDVYDMVTDTWSVTSLKYPSVSHSAAAVGNKVFFAGGFYRFPTWNGGWRSGISDQVEIYDIATGTWAETKLSETKWHLSVATLDNKVYFAGGVHHGNVPNGSFDNVSAKIEIYDIGTGRWSYSTLTEPKADMAGNGIGGKVYWAGGVLVPEGLTCKVEIHDAIAQTTSHTYLSQQNDYWSSAVKDNKLIYLNSYKNLDIYDVTTSSWSVGVLPQGIPWGFLVSTNNTLYLATGFDNTGILYPQIYKLEF